MERSRRSVSRRRPLGTPASPQSNSEASFDHQASVSPVMAHTANTPQTAPQARRGAGGKSNQQALSFSTPATNRTINLNKKRSRTTDGYDMLDHEEEDDGPKKGGHSLRKRARVDYTFEHIDDEVVVPNSSSRSRKRKSDIYDLGEAYGPSPKRRGASVGAADNGYHNNNNHSSIGASNSNNNNNAANRRRNPARKSTETRLYRAELEDDENEVQDTIEVGVSFSDIDDSGANDSGHSTPSPDQSHKFQQQQVSTPTKAFALKQDIGPVEPKAEATQAPKSPFSIVHAEQPVGIFTEQLAQSPGPVTALDDVATTPVAAVVEPLPAPLVQESGPEPKKEPELEPKKEPESEPKNEPKPEPANAPSVVENATVQQQSEGTAPSSDSLQLKTTQPTSAPEPTIASSLESAATHLDDASVNTIIPSALPEDRQASKDTFTDNKASSPAPNQPSITEADVPAPAVPSKEAEKPGAAPLEIASQPETHETASDPVSIPAALVPEVAPLPSEQTEAAQQSDVPATSNIEPVETKAENIITTEPAALSAANNSAAPAAEISSEPVLEATSETVAGPVDEPTAKPATEPVTEPMAEPTAEVTTEPMAEKTTTQTVASSADEPARELAEEPLVESAAQIAEAEQPAKAAEETAANPTAEVANMQSPPATTPANEELPTTTTPDEIIPEVLPKSPADVPEATSAKPDDEGLESSNNKDIGSPHITNGIPAQVTEDIIQETDDQAPTQADANVVTEHATEPAEEDSVMDPTLAPRPDVPTTLPESDNKEPPSDSASDLVNDIINSLVAKAAAAEGTSQSRVSQSASLNQQSKPVGKWAHLTPYIDGDFTTYPERRVRSDDEGPSEDQTPDDKDTIDMEPMVEDTSDGQDLVGLDASTPAINTPRQGSPVPNSIEPTAFNSPAPAAEEADDADASESQDGAEVRKHFKYPKLRDPEEFVAALENCSEMSTQDLYELLEMVNATMVQWQQESNGLTKVVDDYENAERRRVADAKYESRTRNLHQHGVNYEEPDFVVKGIRAKERESITETRYLQGQDRIMAAAYGFEHDPHPSKIGRQNPDNRQNGIMTRGRSLRNQPRQTVKASEADEGTATGTKRQRKPVQLFDPTTQDISRSSTPVPTRGRRRKNLNGNGDAEEAPLNSFTSTLDGGDVQSDADEPVPKRRKRATRQKQIIPSIVEDSVPAEESAPQPEPTRPARRGRAKQQQIAEYEAQLEADAEPEPELEQAPRRHILTLKIPKGKNFSEPSSAITDNGDSRPSTASSDSTSHTAESSYSFRPKRQKRFRGVDPEESDDEVQAPAPKKRGKRGGQQAATSAAAASAAAEEMTPAPSVATPEPGPAPSTVKKIKLLPSKNENKDEIRDESRNGTPSVQPGSEEGDEPIKDYKSMSKSEKMSASMKNRWKNGDMAGAVEKRKATLAAKKAAQLAAEQRIGPIAPKPKASKAKAQAQARAPEASQNTGTSLPQAQ